MISRRTFLFEAVLVFFVDNDETELPGWREDGAAGADHHLTLPLGPPPPLAAAFDIREMAVQHGHGPETATKAFDRLRREANFGHQHQSLFALTNDFLDGLKIN